MPPIHSPALASSPLVVFGKAPWMGDFVRIGSPGRAGEALEQWVAQGLSRAEARVGSTWASAYAHGSMHAFVYRAPRGVDPSEILAGVILPSTDAVGRSFPLVVYWPIPHARREFRWPHVLPMALGDFFHGAAEAVHGVAGLSGPADLIEALRMLSPPALDRAEFEAHAYQEWATSATIAQAFGVIYGAASGVLAPRAIHVIADAVAPFRGEAAPATTLGLRLPLGSGGAAAAAFWLDVVRRLAGAPNEVRTCFWSFDGTSGSVIVQLGETPVSTLAELWAPDANSETLCDLTQASDLDEGRLLSGLSPSLVEAFHSSGMLVRDFLDRLAL